MEDELKKNDSIRSVHRYPVLGCEDEVILLEDISWRELWRMYRDMSGCLSNSNGVYNASVKGITTLILQGRNTAESQKGISMAMNGDLPKKVKNVCKELRKECLGFYDTIKGGNEDPERMYYKAILQIINSLQKYASQEYVDYTYVTLYKPMKMLLLLMKEAKSQDRENILDEISRFFYAINLLTQNSVRLERQFIQSVELNVRIYEAPVQLSTFYAAYFSLLRDILNQNSGAGHSYEFMICPGMTEHLNVRKLFPKASRTKRLLLVEIPENQMFNIKNQLIMMVHEAAHFVGRNIRQRRKRYRYMLRAITQSVATFLILDKDMHQYCRRESVKQFEMIYFDELKKEAETYDRKLREISNGDREVEGRFYAEYMRDDLKICSQNVLLGNMELLDGIGGNAFYWKFNSYQMRGKDPSEKVKIQQNFKMEFQENKTKFLIQMLLPSDTLSDERCIENIVDNNIHLFKESFADLMSVLLLELTEKEYIDTILQVARREDTKKPFNTAMWRIALVIKTMCGERGEGNFKWEMDTLKELAQEEKDEKKSELIKSVLELVENYL